MRIDCIAGNWNWSILAGFGGGVKRGRETLRAFIEAEAMQEFNCLQAGFQKLNNTF